MLPTTVASKLVGLFLQSDEKEHDDGRASRDDRCCVVTRVMADEHGDFVRDAVALVAHELMEPKSTAEVGAELGEASETRLRHRNGYRPGRGGPGSGRSSC